MQKKLLINGSAFKRTDGRWCGVVWYMDEKGARKRKSFSGTTKQEVNKKMTDYIAEFNEAVIESDESNKFINVAHTSNYNAPKEIICNQCLPFLEKGHLANDVCFI